MSPMLVSTESAFQGRTVTQYLLGIDLGAGSLKATLIDTHGRIKGEGAHAVTTAVPHFGWSEQDPEEWFKALCAAVPRAIAAAGIAPGAIAAIGISAGAHIPVLTDEHDNVLRPAIMWNDQRAAAEAAELHARAGEQIIKTALNRVNPTWTLAMLAWLQKHEPGVMARATKLHLAKDYLRYRLTGSWATDVSDAIGALMADNATGTWSPALTSLIGLDPALLPPILPATALGGHITPAASALTGLKAGTPVVVGANDTTVEFFGVGATRPGIGGVKLATAGVLYLATQGPAVHPPISCYPHIMPGLYYTATGTNSCASAHRWLRDLMFAEGGFARMDELAAQTPRGARGLLFHPYLQGERAPYWDPLLRADFVGLTISHGPAEFARALYEGLAFSIRDLLMAARGLGLSFGAIRLMGGGARSAAWRQIIADITGLTIERTEASDASFGAALVAGIGAGQFTSPEEAVANCVRLLDVTTPDPEAQAFYDQLFGLYKETQAALADINHRLHALTNGA
ncbi:xylulokinase [Acidocella sp.]|uniref:xylulokinase n=1 Tax=Acidocella sp. TaxID=50710 RepID=UPI002614E771|nr:FGGY family carbohydrate kinase [Acidocella sp.]